MKLGLQLNQRQELRLLPQIIQRTEILALPAIELEYKIQEELLENPVLELEMEGPEPDEVGGEIAGDEDKSELEAEVGIHEETYERQASAEEHGDNGEFARTAVVDEIRLNNLEASLDEYFSGRAGYAYSSDDDHDAKMDALANTPVDNDNFYEHLLAQLRLMDLDPDTCKICTAIVYRLDENGFFKCDLDEIARDLEGELEFYPREAEDCLGIVQKLDPPGVGARNLRECLLLQMRSDVPPAPLAREIVANFFDDLARNRLPVIAKALDIDVKKVVEAVRYISHLSPSPMNAYSARPADLIVPDVTVYRRADSFSEEIENIYDLPVTDIYEVEVREGLASHVKRNPLYDNLLKKLKNKSDRSFLKEKIDAAKLLLKAIEERRYTLERITWKIVERQREFFEDGPVKLRPMKMKEIADELRLHVATISRATKGKYIQTPQGVFSFKSFFTTAAKNEGAEDESVIAVKRALKKIVDEEDKNRPYSDQQIAKLLKKNGFEVARRTVVKYRDQAGIPCARERREFV